MKRSAHFLFALLAVFPLWTFAANDRGDGLSMTITPPLFQLSLAPGTVWKSAVNLRNDNPYDLTLFSFTQTFNTSGESGMAVFGPSGSSSSPNSHELATWITLSGDPVLVKKGKVAHIPFTIKVPKDAEPGGHYAAILIGTQPSDTHVGGGAAFGTLLSSLFFVRIAGDVVEEANIHDFYAIKRFIEAQQASFMLRFENTGNVHVIPKGEITIYNMFGKTRGRIAVDGARSFGTILPQTTRKYSFEWKGDNNFFDIGRYRAVATLHYGMDGEKVAERVTHFWVLPWIPLISMIFSLTAFFLFVRRALRRYVARAIAMEEARLGITHEKAKQSKTAMTFAVLKRPFVDGATDLRRVGEKQYNKENPAQLMTYRMVARKYRTFLLSCLIFLVGLIAIIVYFYEVFGAERGYDMIIKKDGVHDIVVHGGEE